MSANVAELVKEMHAEAHRGAAAMLERYVALVKQAAKDKLSPADAEQAAALAYDLELPADRFDRDVATARQEAALAKQLVIDEAEKARSREQLMDYKRLLEELELERRKVLAEQQRAVSAGHERTDRKILHAQMLAGSPHLFGDAATLTDAQWKAIRQ